MDLKIIKFKANLIYFFGVFITLLLSVMCLLGCSNSDFSDKNSKIPLKVTYTAATGGKIRRGEDLNLKTEIRYTLIYKDDDVEKITAVPDEGYYFVKWSDGVTDFIRQDKKVQSDLEFVAEFSPITDAVSVVYSTWGDGLIRGKAEQTIQRGTEAQPVEAILYGGATGMAFVRWSDGLTDPVRQDINVTESMEITAEFGHTIDYSVVGKGTIVGNASQVVIYGQHAETVTALPDRGYRFVAWSDGVKTATRTDTYVTTDIKVHAVFEWRDTDIFTYCYNYATENCYEDGLILTRGQVGNKKASVPAREFFTFGGWYLDEKFTQQAFDANGNNLLGEELFNSPSRDLYAKWNVIDEHVNSYKILMVYVTQMDGTFVGNDGQNIAVHYTMPQELKLQCIELTKRFRDTLNDMLDGLVNFEISSFFTTKSVDESHFTNEEYSYGMYILADQIPELKNSGVLDDYRSVLTIYSFGNEKELLPPWSGLGGEKYAAVPIDENIWRWGTLERALEDYGGIVGTCIHEFIHTIEYGITCYEYHRANHPKVPEQITDKLFLLNRFPTDFYDKLRDDSKLWKKEYFLEAWKNSPKVGIPYGVWANEILDVTIKPECINGRPGGNGSFETVDTGGRIDQFRIPSHEFDWWYDRGGTGYTQKIPKGSRSTLLFANPKKGYRFLGWSDGVQDEFRVLTDVQENIVLIAYFERLSYTVEYVAGEGGRIEGETVQNVLTGDRTTWVTAVPDEGYRFVGWSDNNQGYFGGPYETRFDIVGSNIYNESGELVVRLGFSVTAIFEKIGT